MVDETGRSCALLFFFTSLELELVLVLYKALTNGADS